MRVRDVKAVPTYLSMHEGKGGKKFSDRCHVSKQLHALHFLIELQKRHCPGGGLNRCHPRIAHQGSKRGFEALIGQAVALNRHKVNTVNKPQNH